MLKIFLLFQLVIFSINANQKKPKIELCDIGNIQVRIVGVCYQSNYLWFIVESDQVKTYMVYEFHKKDTIYETVIDSKRIKRIVPLQKMWSIDESIHPFDGGRRLLSAYGLDESQYEWKINLKMKNHSTISGGIVFIFEKDKPEIYDFSTGVTFTMETLPERSLLLPLEEELGSRIDLHLNDKKNRFRYHIIRLIRSITFEQMTTFHMAEGPSITESIDRSKDRLLLLATGKHLELLLSNQSNLFHMVQWKWLQGFIDPNNRLIYLFTDLGIYIFLQPTVQLPEMIFSERNVTNGQINRLYPFRMLRLDYDDFFVCNKSNDAPVWNRMFVFILFGIQMSDKENFQTRTYVILGLFSMHLLTAVVLIIVMIAYNTNVKLEKRSMIRSGPQSTKIELNSTVNIRESSKTENDGQQQQQTLLQSSQSKTTN